MFYFIPAWYDGPFAWHDNTAVSDTPEGRPHFDDTSEHLRMFLGAGEAVCLLTLSYQPELRRVLHRQGLYGIRTVSVFDLMQGIREKEIGLLRTDDLTWPEGIEWSETPFQTFGYVADMLFCKIDYNAEGAFSRITYYTDDKLTHTDYYDDRGFLSGRHQTKEGGSFLYFDEAGKERFRVSLSDGEVTIADPALLRVENRTYDDLSYLIADVLLPFVEQETAKEDIFVIASDQRHNSILQGLMAVRKSALSFYGDRYDLTNRDTLLADVKNAALLVTDTEHLAGQIKNTVEQSVPVRDILPYDTRLKSGSSAQIAAQKIYFAPFGGKDTRGKDAMRVLLRYAESHPDAEIICGARDASEEGKIRGQVKEILEKERLHLTLEEAGKNHVAENDALPGEVKEMMRPRVFVRRIRDERELAACLTDVRLIVDLSDLPDLYLQIAAISIGIPQVCYKLTRYVRHKMNGYIVYDTSELPAALDYFLAELKHWNEALVSAVQLRKRHTGGKIVAEWKEAIRS